LRQLNLDITQYLTGTIVDVAKALGLDVTKKAHKAKVLRY